MTSTRAIAEAIPPYPMLARELERCGWTRASQGPLADAREGGFFFHTAQGGVRPPVGLFRAARGETLLLVIDFGDLALAERSDLFPRFLDFPMETRLALGAAHALARAELLLLRASGRAWLIRLPEERIDYEIAGAREFEDELLPALAARARSKPEGLPQAPSHLEGAEALRGWLKHWGRRLGDALGVEAEACEVFVWKFALMLQTRRKTGDSEALGGWGLACEKLADVWSLSFDASTAQEDFVALIDEFDAIFSTRVISGDAETHRQWLAALEETSLIEQLRAEMLMQAREKFEAETAAWLFSPVEREQEGWRREVAGLPPVRKQIAHEGWMVVRPLVCDVARHGLSAALRDADRLAQYWADQAAFVEGAEPGPTSAFSQPDLFFPAPRGVDARGRRADPINFIFSESLRLTNVAPHEAFGAGLVFLLKALDWARRHDWPFKGVDTIDKLFAD